MKQFALIQNDEKDPRGEYTEQIVAYLQNAGANVTVLGDASLITKPVDACIVLGGDGTVLRAAGALAGKDIPLMGINLGTLGYLTEVSFEDAYPALDALIADAYSMEDRMMLEAKVVRDGTVIEEKIALNDIVISRHGPLRIMQFLNYVNGKLLSTVNADGMIVSTPTGSTGYSLSAGGPVVSPQASLFILTALAPHTIGLRSIVLPDSDTIQIVVGADRKAGDKTALLYADGEGTFPLFQDDSIMITKATVGTRMIRLGNSGFLDILRQKMQAT